MERATHARKAHETQFTSCAALDRWIRAAHMDPRLLLDGVTVPAWMRSLDTTNERHSIPNDGTMQHLIERELIPERWDYAEHHMKKVFVRAVTVRRMGHGPGHSQRGMVAAGHDRGRIRPRPALHRGPSDRSDGTRRPPAGTARSRVLPTRRVCTRVSESVHGA